MVLIVAVALALLIGLSVGLHEHKDDEVANIYESVEAKNIQKHLAALFDTVRDPDSWFSLAYILCSRAGQ